MKKNLLFVLLVVVFSLIGVSLSAQALGDVNRDGFITITDALMIVQAYVGSVPANFDASAADVNCSDSITIIDALLVAQYSVNLIYEFPCSVTPTPQPTPTPTQGSTFHVFLLLGQSNMAGYPKAQASDKVANARIQVLGYEDCSSVGRHKDQWDVAVPPLHECWVGAIGPGDWFAKTIIDVLPSGDTIGLVPCAISGEKIETFMKNGGSKYNWIIQRARMAQQKGGVIEGIIFHQGESNSGDSSWPGKVKTLIQDIRSDLGIGNVPFLAGELLYSGGCAGHNTLVNQLPGIINNAYVVSASGLVVDPSDTQWRLHFSHDSQVTLGIRYAQKMMEALGW